MAACLPLTLMIRFCEHVLLPKSPLIRKVKEQLAKRVALIPFQAEEPVGVERLSSLASTARLAATLNLLD